MVDVIAAKRPYRVFDYERDGRTCWMVSTLAPPQQPVALCGPDKAFADELCDAMNRVEPDAEVWLRDLDGTGSMHPCTPHCPGAIRYIRADLA